MDIGLLINLLEPLRNLIESLKTRREVQGSEEEEALIALYVSLNETRIYLGLLDRKIENRNMETEAKLSRLWTAASIKLRRINHDLAERCYIKADYWANPDTWSDTDIKRAKIGVDRIFREAKKLL